MFDFLFAEGQYAIKLGVGLIVVIGSLAAFFWARRWFVGDRLGKTAARGHQRRLSVIDAATVDRRRRLVLIRRDNVEHLLIIGGPTDVVVEQNIVRGAAPREVAPPHPPAATDALPRAVPLPLEPAPRSAPRLAPAPRPEPRPQRAPPVAEQRPPPVAERRPSSITQQRASPRMGSVSAAPPPPGPRERRPRTVDPLAGLAEELARVPAAPEPSDREPPPRQTEPSPARQMEPPPPSRFGDEMEPTPRREPPPRREPRAPRPQPATPTPVQAAPPPAPAAEPQFTSSADQNLAEMVHRLEAALRGPVNNEEGWPAASASRQPAPSIAQPAGSPEVSKSPRRKDTAKTEALVALWGERDVRAISETLPLVSRQMDNVECSVFAPARPERGRPFFVQALLHRTEQLLVAVKSALAVDAGANRKGFAKLSTKIKRGALVQLFLEIPTLAITTPLQEVTWEGEPVRVVYSVDVPLTARLGPCLGTLHIMLEGVPIGEIMFELHIAGRGPRSDIGLGIASLGEPPESEEQVEPVAVTAMKFKRAFVSYSRKDAPQVLLYAKALDECGIELLFDLTSIEPGEEWEGRLSELIDKADVFYLMWSKNAALSQWVEKETLTAVARYDNDPKHVPRIRPVVIEQPMPELPSHLKRFQFHSKWIALRTAQTHSLFSTADRPV